MELTFRINLTFSAGSTNIKTHYCDFTKNIVLKSKFRTTDVYIVKASAVTVIFGYDKSHIRFALISLPCLNG